MSRMEKLIERFLSAPSDFTWDELRRLLRHFGYSEQTGAGSRRKFSGHGLPTIYLHEPHPSRVVKAWAMRAVRDTLRGEGLI